jgi:hypothetical protein
MPTRGAGEVKDCHSSTKDPEVYIMIERLENDGRRRHRPLAVDLAVFDRVRRGLQ